MTLLLAGATELLKPWGGKQASRNGYYFTLDRVTGEHVVTGKFSDTVNWAKGLNDKGQPIRDPARDLFR